MKRLFALLCFLLLAASCSAALADVTVSFSPENPHVGDYVDVVVTPDREESADITWELLFDGEKSIAYKPVSKDKNIKKHTAASFRPRQEGTYQLRVTVTYGKDDAETAEVSVPVSGFAPAQESPDVVYSQKDGWWYKKKYSSKRDLQKAGCAIFALSHALQRMGISDESVTPEQLAKTYSYFYVEEKGTYNEGLINKAAQVYDFLTRKELLKSTKEISDCLERGDMFSFSIVNGHIAIADGISKDGTKVHIVDSAPGATYERITAQHCIFVQNEDGSFTEAASPEDHPGIRWFFETHEYGGMEYWMDIGYCAERGMRLIRMQWLKAETENGLLGVTVEYAGALVTKVTREKESWRVPTRDLLISGKDASVPRVALVTAKNGTSLRDGSGKVLSGKTKIPRQTMVLVLHSDDSSVYVWWNDTFGYLDPAAVTLLPAETGSYQTGVIVKNGNTSGNSQVTVHLNPSAKSTGLKTWKTGTPVAIVEKSDSFYLVEGKGLRGWVHEKYILLDQQEESGENNTEGSEENGQKIDKGE